MATRGRGRSLDPDEAELWERVARTVRPLEPTRRRVAVAVPSPGQALIPPPPPVPRVKGRVPPPSVAPPAAAAPRPLDRHGLDSSWDRRLGKGTVSPDFTLDLHGASLEAAHARLDHGLALALAQGARVVLLVTGRARGGHEPADRGNRRGVIRAKFLDWLEAGPHAGAIAAIRPAHPRHGGAGAVYIVLRRGRG